MRPSKILSAHFFCICIFLGGERSTTSTIMQAFNSKVSAFFGKKNQEETTTCSLSPITRGRQGVGSNVAKKDLRTGNVGRMLLNVGGKRNRRSEDEGDDDEEESLSHENNDEDVGRTEIAEKSTPKEPATAPFREITPPSKKKKGKKKRQAEMSQHLQQSEEAASMDGAVENGSSEAALKAKRKKRKVRSRQKNIYKDNRLAQHKPSHLILGRPDYQGRPLTAETRVKLNLPPSRSSRHRKNSEDTHPKETTCIGHSAEGNGMKLAIDDLFDVQEMDGNAVDAVVSEPKTTKKKRKKSKYKNIP